MPTPNGDLTTSEIWVQPQEVVEEVTPVVEEVKEEE
jgi:hypothetical protein